MGTRSQRVPGLPSSRWEGRRTSPVYQDKNERSHRIYVKLDETSGPASDVKEKKGQDLTPAELADILKNERKEK